jgi:hypothetical protein
MAPVFDPSFFGVLGVGGCVIVFGGGAGPVGGGAGPVDVGGGAEPVDVGGGVEPVGGGAGPVDVGVSEVAPLFIFLLLLHRMIINFLNN